MAVIIIILTIHVYANANVYEFGRKVKKEMMLIYWHSSVLHFNLFFVCATKSASPANNNYNKNR
jgi:hypothetical protein